MPNLLCNNTEIQNESPIRQLSVNCRKPQYLWSPEKRIDFLNEMWQALHIKDSFGRKKFPPAYLYMLVKWEFSIGHLYSEEVNQFMRYLTEHERAGLKKIMIHNGYVLSFADDSKYKRIIMAVTLCTDAGSPELIKRADRIRKIVSEAEDGVDVKDLYPQAIEILQSLGEEFNLQLAVTDDGKMIYEIPSEVDEK